MKPLPLLLLLALPLSAQDLSGFEKVLLPAWTPQVIHGANDTTFATTFHAEVRERDVAFFPARVEGSEAPQFGVFRANVASPITPTGLIHDAVPAAGGKLLYIEKGAGDRITFGYAVTSATPNGGHYAQLPVVRERDFRTGPLDIPLVSTWPIYGVPFQPSTVTYRDRHTLRIYDVDNTGALRVHVTWGWQPEAPTREGGFVNVDRRDSADPSYPYYAAVDLDTLVPPCFGGISGTQPCAPILRTIRVTPVSPGIRFWAFATTTSNTTQEVTAHWPQ